MPKGSDINVVLLDDDVQNCALIEDVLKDSRRINLLGYCLDSSSFKQLVKRTRPDVALLDIALKSNTEGVDVLVWLTREYPDIKSIMITVYPEHIRKCYGLGARGYLLKGNWKDIAPTISKVHKGELIIPPGTAPVLIKQFAKLEGDYSVAKQQIGMSKKEIDILEQLVKGKRKKEISENMGISYYTLKRHLQNIRQKSNVKTTRELISKFSPG
jgi:DNA-binding NarL/FixJ family response regulator